MELECSFLDESMRVSKIGLMTQKEEDSREEQIQDNPGANGSS